MLTFLHGEDRYRMKRRAIEYRAAFLREHHDGEVVTIDAEEGDPYTAVKCLLEAAEPGLFASEKLVILESPFGLPDTEKKRLPEYLPAFAKSASADMLVVQPTKPRKNETLYTFLVKNADKTEEFAALKEGELERFALAHLKARGVTLNISREALQYLVREHEGDSAGFVSDLEKLSLYKPEGEISLADARALCDESPRETVFDALDALIQGNRERALLLLVSEERERTKDAPLLYLCAWRVRELVALREAYDGGIRQASDAARALKMNPYSVGKSFQHVTKLSLPRLKNALKNLASLEVETKTGGLDPETALTLFALKF